MSGPLGHPISCMSVNIIMILTQTLISGDGVHVVYSIHICHLGRVRYKHSY